MARATARPSVAMPSQIAGRTLRFDATNYRFQGDEDAAQYLTRPEYRKPWLLPKPDEV